MCAMEDTLPNSPWWVLQSMVRGQMYKLQITRQSGKRTENKRMHALERN